MRKIGFFGGSFNPATFAHINLAKEIVDSCNLDKLIFVPMSNFYEKDSLIEFKFRYDMLNLICSKIKKLEVSDIENKKNSKLYAIDIFEIIEDQYKNDDIYYIMGSDNLEKIETWKGYNDLVTKYKYIILERKQNAFEKIVNNNIDIKKHKDNFEVVSNHKYNNISSSLVRDKIKKNEDVSDLVPKEIAEYIKENNLYK